MPTYRVIAQGFIGGSLQYPGGKPVITDKPLDPVPSWLKSVKPETRAERKKRETAEKKLADEVAEGKVEAQGVNFNNATGVTASDVDEPTKL